MKKLIMIILMLSSMLLFAACTDNSDDQAASSGKTSGSEAAEPASQSAIPSDKIFKPGDVLSADEAAALVGKPVAIDPSSTAIDPESGTVYARYVYSGEDGDIDALIMIKQDSAMSKGNYDNGNTAEAAYEQEFSMNEGKSETVDGLGDKAFIQTEQNQVFLLVDGCYICVAFSAGDLATDKDLNLAIAEKIVENIQK